MMRTSKAEAFARLLDGAPAGSVPASVAALGGIVASLRAIPQPALPAGLLAGRAALVHAAAAPAVHSAAVMHTALTHSTLTHVATKTAASKVGALKSAFAGLAAAHLSPVAAGATIVAVGLTATGVGAARSIPGDPLYGVKRTIESLQVDATTSNVSAAEERLAQVRTRLDEAAALRDKHADTKLIVQTVKDWTTGEAKAMTVLGPLAAQPEIHALLESFLTDESKGLATMPAAAVAAPLAELSQLSSTLAETAGTRIGVPPALTPGTTLKLPNGTTVTVPKVTVPKVTIPTITVPTAAPGLKHPTVTLPTAKAPTAAVTRAPSTTKTPAKTGLLPTSLPTALPTNVLPTNVLPTSLPTALPTNPLPTNLLPTNLVPGAVTSLIPSIP